MGYFRNFTPCKSLGDTLHNPAAIRQHLRGLGDQEVLRLRTSGTTQRIWVATLVQAATLGEGFPDFIFHAFLHVARNERFPLATPDGESPPSKGIRVWAPPLDWGRHLVGHPEPGRTDYHEPNMPHLKPSNTSTDTKALDRATWVDRVASLSNFRDDVPGDVPTPDNQHPAPPRT